MRYISCDAQVVLAEFYHQNTTIVAKVIVSCDAFATDIDGGVENDADSQYSYF